MGTYDGWWEMRYNNNEQNSSYSGYDSKSSYKSPVSIESKKEPVVFQPIVSVVINTSEWKAAKQGMNTDCSIMSGEQIFTVHKFKLMIHSHYFKDRIGERLDVTEIRCDMIDPKVLKVLLKFIYLGAVSKNAQKDIMDGKMDFLEIMDKARELGIKGFAEWSEALLSSYLQKNKVSPLKFSEWFSLACQENSISLFWVLLNGIQFEVNGIKALINAVGAASMAAYINKENWTTIKNLAKTVKSSEIRRIIDTCETYNPIIQSVLK